jgi:hypothetical protein
LPSDLKYHASCVCHKLSIFSPGTTFKLYWRHGNKSHGLIPSTFP